VTLGGDLMWPFKDLHMIVTGVPDTIRACLHMGGESRSL
jgi:hypothetical protein